MTFGQQRVEAAQRGVFLLERRLAQRDELLVAQVFAQPVDFGLQGFARGEALLQPAPGRGRGVDRELQRVDSRLQAVTRGVEPAAALWS